MLLKSTSFVLGLLAGVTFFSVIGTLRGESFPGLIALSVFVGIAVGGSLQALLLNKFVPKVVNDE